VIAELVRVWSELPPDQRDAARRDQVMKLWVRAEVLRLTNIRARVNRTLGDPGPEGSIAKAASAALNKDALDLAVTLLGPEGTLYGDYTMRRPRFSADVDNVQKAFLRSRANSIEGGTSEVMYNILGERVLGLPGDVRVDRDVPWSQVPRN
jgi:alkylation response protein AidB-like acyl-CoA dehydrogenase